MQPVDRFWAARVDARSGLRLYGPDPFCHTLAHQFGIRLAVPQDRLLARLPARLLHRRVWLDTLAGLARRRRRPRFVKPVEPKLFRAQVTDDPARILGRYSATRPTTPVLAADVVAFAAEVRVFVLDNAVATAASYRGKAAPEDALGLVRTLLPLVRMPRAWVVDVGRLASGEWAVVEFNAVHAAAAYACEPTAVARCLAVNAVASAPGRIARAEEATQV